eukprot:4424534-Heterocapsa_arctica.AAC.1
MVAVRTQMAPKPPSPPEVEQHRLTHLPYASWCKVCIEARGRDAPPTQVTRTDAEIPLVQMEYVYLSTDQSGDQAVPVLVTIDKATGYMVASVCR